MNDEWEVKRTMMGRILQPFRLIYLFISCPLKSSLSSPVLSVKLSVKL